MINIKAPRYRDKTVLLARYKLPCGCDAMVNIESGAYAGTYKVPNQAICKAPIEGLETKSGKFISVRAVPLDALERIS